jgi:hypothetical protein
LRLVERVNAIRIHAVEYVLKPVSIQVVPVAQLQHQLLHVRVSTCLVEGGHEIVKLRPQVRRVGRGIRKHKFVDCLSEVRVREGEIALGDDLVTKVEIEVEVKLTGGRRAGHLERLAEKRLARVVWVGFERSMAVSNGKTTLANKSGRGLW